MTQRKTEKQHLVWTKDDELRITKVGRFLRDYGLDEFPQLINIIKVLDLTDQDFVERELVLVKVTAKTENRAEILRITDIFRGQVVDVGLEHYTLNITGDAEKITAILSLLRPFGIREIARTGCIAMFRENKHKS